MKNKLLRIGRLLYAFIFILALFTLIQIICKFYYQLQMNKKDYTLVMAFLDSAHMFQLKSYIYGWLHCAVVGVMLKIILDK